ncbi:MAG: mevalonate 5-phosphate dehydratase small subunit [Methanoculleus sp.]|nr:mevalonate 5-phosphate dehydratase small subunit [Methanoculleus sp.]
MQGRSISRGIADGELLVSSEPISFLSGVDPNTGIVVEHGHPLEGQSIAGRVLAFPYGKGSTVGSYVIYALKQNDLAPAAIINTEAEPIIAAGAIIAGIPMVDRLPPEFSRLPPGIRVTVNGDTGEVSYDETA